MPCFIRNFMGESSRSQQPLCPCGFWGSPKTLGLCSKCYSKASHSAEQEIFPSDVGSTTAISTATSPKTQSRSRMDSKHFPSRSTTDNLPSSLSTPGERTQLTAAPSASVEATSPASSSSNTNALSSHMSTSCSTSSNVEMASKAAVAKSEAENSSRLSPVINDSETSTSASSECSFDPKFDTGICSSDSCSSIPSSISAALSSSSSSSSFVHNTDEHIVADIETTGLSIGSSLGLSQTDKDIGKNSQAVFGPDISTSSTTAVGMNAIKNNVAPPSNTNSERHEDQDDNDKLETSVSDPSQVNLASNSDPSHKLPISVDETSTKSSSPRGMKRSRNEMESTAEEASSSGPSPQKNKKRCFTCSCKLELAQRTIGKCRCDRIFCAVHRLPELHNCDFNHKEDGRREAREKMVKPTRHMGTSFRRDEKS